VRADKDLEHPQRRIVCLRALFVPEAAAGVHHKEVRWVGDELVSLPIVVAHDSPWNPRNDLLVSVFVHPDQRVGVDERLDNRRKRPVAVIVVAGEIEPDPKRSLVDEPVASG